MAHKWKRSVIRMPIGSDHDREFNLKWWRLNITAENGYARYEKFGFSGITITGFSDHEYDEITSWCQHRGVFRIGKVKSFDDSIGTNRISRMPNSDGLSSFSYREREFGIFGMDSNIGELETYITSMPSRNLETFVHGLPRSEIKRMCGDSNHRLISGTSGYHGKNVIAISTGDNRMYLEFYLRSKNGVETE